MNSEIDKAKDAILDAIAAYNRLACAEDGEPQRTVLDWIVVYHSRGFDEPSPVGGDYALIYAPGVQYHGILGLLQVGVEALDNVTGSGDD